MIERKEVDACTCERCGREFVPLRCPECKNTSWNKEDVKRGRPRKEIAPAPVEAISQPQPKREEIEQPRRQVKRKRELAVAKRLEKIDYCPHKFMVLPDGTTACPKCKIA